MSENRIDKSSYIYTIIAMILSFAGIFYNALFFPALIFSPVFMAFAFLKYTVWEYLYVSMSLAVFNTLCCYVTGTDSMLYGLCVSFGFSLVGLIVGYSFKSKQSFKNILFVLLIFYMICVLFVCAYIKYIIGTNISAVLKLYFTEAYYNLSEAIKIYLPDIHKQIMANEYNAYNTFYMILPGLLPFALSVVIVAVAIAQYVIARVLFKNTLIETASFADGVDTFRLTAVTNIVYIICLLTFATGINKILTMIALNIFLMISVFYCIEAAAIAYHRFKQITPSYLKRFFMMIAVLLGFVGVSLAFPTVNIIYLVVFIGFTDSIFNYRKLGFNKDEENEE